MEEFLRVMRGELHIAVNAVLAPKDLPESFQPQNPIQHYAPMVSIYSFGRPTDRRDGPKTNIFLTPSSISHSYPDFTRKRLYSTLLK